MKNFLFLLVLFVSTVALCFPGGEAKMDVDSNQISILTWNIKMLPRGATFLDHHPIKRAHIIPGILMKEAPDVIVFQESYDGLAMRIIRKKLKPLYPHTQGFQNKKVITYKRAGGVIMFSKYPIKEVESIKYSWLEGIDKLAAKGALLAEVEHPVVKFQVLGTHMEAGGSRELKISQYKEAGELLKRHEADGVPQFACGDFNTRRIDTILYPKLLSALEMEDGEICTDLKCTSDHLLNDMDNYNPNKRNLIDYVFFKSKGVEQHNTTRSVLRYEHQWNKRHKDLSDHFAVLLRTYFKR
jgi:endonuclease/exonuclease/phosphatase family metal-dependent hydrolase